MNTFFDEDNNLNIEDLVYEQPSFLKIIEDGVVTEDELAEQSDRVISRLKSFESKANAEQIEEVRNLLAEISVLVAARSIFERQAE
ncbi:MAG: hypothetical protein ACI3ZO_09785 [Candidatus Cryptobacteroides sp.]